MPEILSRFLDARRRRAEARAWRDLAERMAWRDCGIAEPLWRYNLRRWWGSRSAGVRLGLWIAASAVGAFLGVLAGWFLYVLAVAATI